MARTPARLPRDRVPALRSLRATRDLLRSHGGLRHLEVQVQVAENIDAACEMSHLLFAQGWIVGEDLLLKAAAELKGPLDKALVSVGRLIERIHHLDLADDQGGGGRAYGGAGSRGGRARGQGVLLIGGGGSRGLGGPAGGAQAGSRDGRARGHGQGGRALGGGLAFADGSYTLDPEGSIRSMSTTGLAVRRMACTPVLGRAKKLAGHFKKVVDVLGAFDTKLGEVRELARKGSCRRGHLTNIRRERDKLLRRLRDLARHIGDFSAEKIVFQHHR